MTEPVAITDADRQQVRDFVEKWRPRLFMHQYDVRVVFEDADDGDVAARCIVGRPYHLFTVKVYPLFFKSDAQRRERFVVHEMAHVITERVYELICEAQQDKNVTNREREFAREEATDWIANIAVSLGRRAGVSDADS